MSGIDRTSARWAWEVGRAQRGGAVCPFVKGSPWAAAWHAGHDGKPFLFESAAS